MRLRITYCFPGQQWLREPAPALGYMYIDCLLMIQFLYPVVVLVHDNTAF